jgi:4,5-dihydroxyphthalate decarboxylase
MKLTLSIGMSRNPRTRPIFDGSVTADGIDLIPTALHPSELFWRQLRFGDFDIAEMSISSLLITIARGDDRWVGLPIFTTRWFFHTDMLARRDAGIESPADLKGKRVGVPEYQQTAALWARGALQHEFGVAPKDMQFWMERTPDHSHGGATGFTPPPGVVVNQIPAEKNIASMLLSGELQATLRYIRQRDGSLVDRSTADLLNHPDIKPVFPDPVAEGTRYFNKSGLFPINHGMVIKRAVAEKSPWAVLNLLKAFERANDAAEAARREHVEYHIRTGLLPRGAPPPNPNPRGRPRGGPPPHAHLNPPPEK